MNDGVGESAKKAKIVAMGGNMTFGWLMKITSPRLGVAMAPFQKALLTDSDEGRLFKGCFNSLVSRSECCAAQPPKTTIMPTLTTSL
jgi:hypothetical protein